MRWLSARAWTTQWYPQGVDVGTWRGEPAIATSWFRQDADRKHVASRITLVDLDRSRRIDIALAVLDGHGALQPAQIHAGGLAWFDDRLFVAATGRGIWEFDLSEVQTVDGETAHRLLGSNTPKGDLTMLAVARTRVHAVDLRCSFIGRSFGQNGEPLDRVLIGEYATDKSGRVGSFLVDQKPGGTLTPDGRFTPEIDRMQGAVQWGNNVLISQSVVEIKPGTLWIGVDEKFKPARALPAGPEDLALDPKRRSVWSVAEHPFKRVVREFPLKSLGI